MNLLSFSLRWEEGNKYCYNFPRNKDNNACFPNNILVSNSHYFKEQGRANFIHQGHPWAERDLNSPQLRIQANGKIFFSCGQSLQLGLIPKWINASSCASTNPQQIGYLSNYRYDQSNAKTGLQSTKSCPLVSVFSINYEDSLDDYSGTYTLILES